MIEDDLKWFAGFFDGEGCVNIRIHHPNKDLERSHYMCRICLTGTDQPIMEWIQKTFGGNLCVNHRKTHYKPVFHWTFSGPPMTRFLESFTPYLRVKKPQALIMLRFRSTFTHGNRKPLSKSEEDIRADCIQRLHFLNHRGTTAPCPLSPSALR